MLSSLKKEDLKIFEEKTIDLLIESYSNSARTVQIRGFSEINIISADHTTNGNRTKATSIIPLSEIPISIIVSLVETGVSRGECYVRVLLRSEGVVIGILGARYITDGQTLSWPDGIVESPTEGKGFIRSIVGTDPAAGIEISETVPTNTKWKLKAFNFNLVNSATVANRYPALLIDDGTNALFYSQSITAQTASQNIVYTGGDGTTGLARQISVTQLSLPNDLILKEGMRIGTTTVALQAGDNWAAPNILVEEWIDI